MFCGLRGGLVPEDTLVPDIGFRLATAMMRHDGFGLTGPRRCSADRGAPGQRSYHGSKESGALTTSSHDITSSKKRKLTSDPGKAAYAVSGLSE